ncbi:hypothetical protein NIES4073_84800 [Kalymmatonema gypsitolerans NIES-4073]|nr:hypothetical protein NIES4073_84800 [Scytonema sp. NIES-4073]
MTRGQGKEDTGTNQSKIQNFELICPSLTPCPKVEV